MEVVQCMVRPEVSEVDTADERWWPENRDNVKAQLQLIIQLLLRIAVAVESVAKKPKGK